MTKITFRELVWLYIISNFVILLYDTLKNNIYIFTYKIKNY